MKYLGAKLFLAALLPVIQSVADVGAQTRKPLSLAELAAYTGSDREQRLIEGAKAEGKVVWYTSLAGSSYKEITKGFETKYPGIKVETYRGTSTDIMTRISAEAQAKQILADVLETTVPPLTYLRENKLLAPYTSPHLGKYPAGTKETAGRGLVYWAVDRET
jgi:iron(III) transport system substrate-binding protein